MEILLARAFVTAEGLGGNPAGVVLGAEKLPPSERQQLATRLNFSETAFHSRSSTGVDELEFFTPNRRINNCGHGTVAAFSALARSRQNGDYRVRISHDDYTVRIKDDLIGLKQNVLSVSPLPQDRQLEAITSLRAQASIIKSMALVDVGVKYLVIEVDTLKHLNTLEPDMQMIKEISEKEEDMIGYYLYSQEHGQYYSRMFGPAYGIPEESATGMGAICMMAKLSAEKRLAEINVIQGLGMTPPTPSLLQLKVQDSSIWVFGRAVLEKV